MARAHADRPCNLVFRAKDSSPRHRPSGRSLAPRVTSKLAAQAGRCDAALIYCARPHRTETHLAFQSASKGRLVRRVIRATLSDLTLTLICHV